MSLKNIKFKREYRTIYNESIREFFIPALKKSVEYNRAVGYFTTDALINLADGILELVKNGGKIKIIASPHLLEKDIETLLKGTSQEESTIIETLLIKLKLVDEMNDKLKMDLIANLIASKILEIKIVYKSKGIYHEKLGVVKDKDGNYVSIEGSNNETHSGQMNNFESFKVFMSWIPGISEYANDTMNHFENLWNGSIAGLNIMSLPEAVEKKIMSSYRTTKDLESAINNLENYYDNHGGSDELQEFVEKKKLYPYQLQAIEEFMEYEYQHFFEMATGTGKTFTSIKALKKIIEYNSPTFIVILVPQIDLQYQWYNELKNQQFKNIYTIGGFIGTNDWKSDFSKSMIEFKLNKNSVIYISTYDSFFSKLNNKVKTIKNLCLVIDEAHNLSDNQVKALPDNAKYRLGLSATPEKHTKAQTEKIVQYFIGENRETFKYSIEEAIAGGFLARYEYFPLFVELTEEEFKSYNLYSQRIAAARSAKIVDQEQINRLLNERSLIVKKSLNKISKLEDMVKGNDYEFKNSVVYCGQGKIEDTEEKIIDQVTNVLYKSKNYRISKFTSDTENRKQVLEEFENGFYDILVAIKCFDEGVDVPKLDKIFIMASDRLKRQTVQRRGRVLRICKESGKEIGLIYDFVVLPPTNENNIGKNLVRNEFYRVREYARLAENKDEIYKTITTIEKQFEIGEDDYIEQD